MQFFITLLPWIQITLSILLVVSVLLQQSSAGVGGIFGGADGGGFKHTRRGFEKFLFQATIVLAVLFGLSAFLTLVL
ncbi:MAG: preprotein translocase subunit SecG [Candidatus Paceibacterota bacterium]